MKSPVLAAAPLMASVAWTVALIIDGAIYEPASVLLIGLGLLLNGVVSVVGMVIAGGRWARRLAFGVVGATILIALIRTVDAAWFVAMGFTVLATVALWSPSVTSRIRRLPAAAGPPERAVVVSVVLLGVPFVMGMSVGEATWAHLTLGISAPLVAFAYARVVAGGLLALRYGWPLLAICLSFPIGLPGGSISLLLGAMVFFLARDESVKVAFHPPREAGSVFPIPPELTPREVLDAAEIDEKGHPT